MNLDKITPADITELTALARRAHGESKYAAFPFSEKAVADTFLECCVLPDRLAVKVQTPTGIAGFFLAEVGGMVFTDQPVAREVSFYVRPESRGTRCAQLLVWAFLDWAAEKKLPCFSTIHFGEDNAKAYRLMEKMGMAELGKLFGKGV